MLGEVVASRGADAPSKAGSAPRLKMDRMLLWTGCRSPLWLAGIGARLPQIRGSGSATAPAETSVTGPVASSQSASTEARFWRMGGHSRFRRRYLSWRQKRAPNGPGVAGSAYPRHTKSRAFGPTGNNGVQAAASSAPQVATSRCTGWIQEHPAFRALRIRRLSAASGREQPPGRECPVGDKGEAR